MPLHRCYTIALSSLVCLVGLEGVNVAVAQTARPRPRSNSQARVIFTPPPGQPAPRSTSSGGRRSNGKCPKDRTTPLRPAAELPLNQRLTPLLPLTNLQRPPAAPSANAPLQPSPWGVTLAAHPTFLVYVPETSATALELKVEGRNGYEALTKVDLPRTSTQNAPMVVPIPLPTTEPPLQVGQDYRWFVSVVCQAQGAPEDSYAEGVVRRITPSGSLATPTQTAPSLTQVTQYAQAGIWYDAIATLATLRAQQPSNAALQTAWRELLDSAGLGAIAPAPIQLTGLKPAPPAQVSTPVKPTVPRPSTPVRTVTPLQR